MCLEKMTLRPSSAKVTVGSILPEEITKLHLILGFLTAVNKAIVVFCSLESYCLVDRYQDFGGILCLILNGRLFSVLKMEVIDFSKTSHFLYRITRRHCP
jgi:hypothetical protein